MFLYLTDCFLPWRAQTNALACGLFQLCPKFLHTNSTSHTWPFSAIAELIGRWSVAWTNFCFLLQNLFPSGRGRPGWRSSVVCSLFWSCYLHYLGLVHLFISSCWSPCLWLWTEVTCTCPVFLFSTVREWWAGSLNWFLTIKVCLGTPARLTEHFAAAKGSSSSGHTFLPFPSEHKFCCANSEN